MQTLLAGTTKEKMFKILQRFSFFAKFSPQTVRELF